MSRLDRLARQAEQKLARVRARESSALSGGQQARLAAATTVIVAKGTRLKSSPAAERSIERVWSEAEQSAAAELDAIRRQQSAQVAAAAEARVAKKTKGWW
ncbi:hypothetical protein [Streptomyces sp. SPB78]|uniref:hypothetical protein n=1 Tax=Streptomyces sp. (strain SPB78) TaxID=591157 RepID=UPI0001B54F61|nr:hypothetical protein [Streptomyces sp. SPB78]